MAKVGEKAKFLTLDGLRGVAAMAVVFVHSNPLSLPALASGALAVDLFFVMSGFVIGHAYEGRMRSGLGVAEFMRLRWVRLYPLYLLGTALFAAFLIWSSATGAPTAPTPAWVFKAALFAIFMAPVPAGLAGGLLYPLYTPAWTLLLELLANLGHAVIGRRLSTPLLAAVVGVAGAFLATCLIHWQPFRQEGIGAHWHTALGGFARVTFGYGSGLLIFRLWRAGRLPKISAAPWALLAIAVLLMAAPANGLVGLASELLVVLVGFPVLVAVAVHNEPSGYAARLFAWAGGLSYPLYALHRSSPYWVGGLATALHLTGQWRPFLGWVSVALSLAAAVLALRFFDGQSRTLLGRVTAKRLPATALA